MSAALHGVLPSPELGAEEFAATYNNSKSKDLHHTLVGNWVEERQLETDTGLWRYKKWVEEPFVAGSVAGGASLDALRTGTISKPSPTKTDTRIITHTERVESKNWRTRQSESHRDPGSVRFSAPVDLASQSGPRQQKALQEMLLEASIVPGVPQNDHAMGTYDEAGVSSEMRGSFKGQAPSEKQVVPIGARVMYTQDGKPIDASRKDTTFAVEVLRKRKGLVDARRIGDDETISAPLGSGSTVYSQLYDRGHYPSADVFGTTVMSSNPFGKNSAFSMPVSDPRKREEEW